MAPQVGQMDRVGAKLRSHTGQFIGFAGYLFEKADSENAKKLPEYYQNLL